MTSVASRRILEGRLAIEVARFGFPLALGMGLQTSFNLVDAYLVARLEPEEAGPALGAIGICDQVGALGTIVSYGVSVATAAILSRRQGEGDRRGVERVTFQSLLVVLGLGALFGVLGVAGADFFMDEVMRAKGDVARLGADYLRVQIGGSLSIFLLLHLTTIQRALGSSKTPVAMLVIANALNLVLTVLLLYGPGPAPGWLSWGPELSRTLGIPRLGLLGAAWATILARVIVLLPVVWVLVGRFGLLRRAAFEVPDWKLIAHIRALSWPLSAQLVVRIAGMLITHRIVAQAFTTELNQAATTAIGIVFRLETMALFVSLGWGSAAQTFVGQNLGAGHRTRAHGSGWYAAAYDAAMMLSLALVYRAFGPEIVAFFDDRADVVAVATSYLDVIAFAYTMLGVSIALGSAVQGAGAVHTTLRADAAVVLAFQLPFSVAAVFYGTDLPTLVDPVRLVVPDPMQRLWLVVALTHCVFAIVYSFVYRRGTFLDVRV